MSKVTLLNLDELAPVRRSVTFGGVTYAVKDMTVEHFIEMNKLAEELEGKVRSTPADDLSATVRSIAMSLEGCDQAIVARLSIEQLAVLAKFIRNEMTPESLAQEAAEGKTEAQPVQG